MKKPYEDIGDGWQPTPRTLDLACCDCSLVHAIAFRFRMVDGKPKFEWKVDRNNRATAQLRRHRKGSHATRRK